MSVFGDRLKELRSAHGTMQKDLALYLGTTTLAYQRYEYGDREPNFEKLVALANYFNVSTDYLLGLSNDPTRR